MTLHLLPLWLAPAIAASLVFLILDLATAAQIYLLHKPFYQEMKRGVPAVAIGLIALGTAIIFIGAFVIENRSVCWGGFSLSLAGFVAIGYCLAQFQKFSQLVIPTDFPAETLKTLNDLISSQTNPAVAQIHVVHHPHSAKILVDGGLDGRQVLMSVLSEHPTSRAPRKWLFLFLGRLGFDAVSLLVVLFLLIWLLRY